ncbi:putative dipeptidyl-peptidase 5 [Aspergillus bertholletiae]|uniref:Dipeptidyl-peptidase V n=1 Tax=Aspergillus bertholletiae TaxID=1226010 RepID=A0A5N7BNQ3_9EURO|nr:putative dipeptidyl-peptidase 5 [Aspergillus bertholletiae]
MKSVLNMGALRWLSIAATTASTALALNPEGLISAPRRSEAVPNPSGDVAFFSQSQYSFETHKTTSQWNVLDLKSGNIKLLTNDSDVSEIVWLGSDDSTVLYVNGTNADIPGGVELWVSDISDFANGYKAASLPAAFSGFKVVNTPSGDVRFVAYAESWANGTAYNEELVAKPLSSARIYDSIYVRHWDYYLTTRFNAVFSGTLKRSGGKGKGKATYKGDGELKNLVSPVRNAESPYPPFGGSSDYDLSPDGKWVAFKSKAHDLPRANYTTAYIFLVPHDGSETAVPINGPDSPGTPDGVKGDAGSPVFSPDSKKVAYWQMAHESYESDHRTLYVYTVGSKKTIPSLAADWDRSLDTVQWADEDNLIIGSEDAGRSRLFSIPADAGDDFKPKNFTDGGVVSAYYQLPDSTYLVTSTALWTSWRVYIASPEKGVIKTLASANEIDPELKGLGPENIDEFFFEGSWTKIQSFIIYPENFDKTKTYPLLYYIHGGPQSSWLDSWSSRWNAKVFADQGYVVVAPNPTGSSGFGDALQDAIQNQWGGYPYEDLVKGWEYINDNFDFIDTDNGVAAGASYGGFMINWIQGSDLGRKFKALVSHDGTFVADAKVSTEELWFMQHEFNGTFWDNRENYRRWDPSAPERILKFSTPMLVIHSDLDYRLPVSEGLSLFNILQERGVPSRFLNFPDENHWVQNKENSLVWHQQVLGWLNKYSGVEESNEDAVSLDDTVVPVVDYNP